eukprot:1144078-Pelagomonas_calceolata.AAC.3
MALTGLGCTLKSTYHGKHMPCDNSRAHGVSAFFGQNVQAASIYLLPLTPNGWKRRFQVPYPHSMITPAATTLHAIFLAVGGICNP